MMMGDARFYSHSVRAGFCFLCHGVPKIMLRFVALDCVYLYFAVVTVPRCVCVPCLFGENQMDMVTGGADFPLKKVCGGEGRAVCLLLN